MKVPAHFLIFLIFFLFLTSCQNINSNSSDREKFGPVVLTGSDDFKASYHIIQNRCVNCHTSPIHNEWSKLRSDDDWLASGKVVRGDPQNSDLINRIINSGSVGADMPKDGSALPTDEYDTLVRWVQNIP